MTGEVGNGKEWNGKGARNGGDWSGGKLEWRQGGGMAGGEKDGEKYKMVGQSGEQGGSCEGRWHTRAKKGRSEAVCQEKAKGRAKRGG